MDRVFIKPNVVFVHDEKIYGKEAYTAKEILEGTLKTLEKEDSVNEIRIGVKGAIGLPTRLSYYALRDALKKHGFKKKIDLYCIEEDKRAVKFVGGNVHSTVRI